jgi:hypothetical protein
MALAIKPRMTAKARIMCPQRDDIVLEREAPT